MRLFLSLGLFFLFTVAVCGQKTGGERVFAPDFKVTSIDGQTFDSAKLKGKVVVLNLWFINCPSCVEEIKTLNQTVDEYQNKDVVFIGMAMNKAADLENFLRKNPFKYNIIPAATQTILSFGKPDKNGVINIPFPTHIVINREGEVVVKQSGIKGADEVKNELKRQFGTR